MTSFKRLVALGIVLAGSALASATNYTFEATDGKWSEQLNWNPQGRPSGTDQATIPSGKRCRIEDQDELIGLLIVDEGGTLRIDGRSLTLWAHETEERIRLNGQIEARGAATLWADGNAQVNHARITGTGVLWASGDGNRLTIRRMVDDICLKVGVGAPNPGPTIKGNITVLDVHIMNNGTFLVDTSGDEMVLGTDPDYLVELAGEVGKFRVTNDGTIRFRRAKPYGIFGVFLGEWQIEGGRMVVPSEGSGWLNSRHAVTLSGGTLEFNTFFVTTGRLNFTGGKMKVGAGGLIVLFKQATD